MKNFGKKITIYLTFGMPKGVREVKIDQWSGMAICGPRNALKDIISLPEINSAAACLYFLAGPSDQGGLLDIYVGEAGSFRERIRDHDYKKNWWEDVIVFITSNESITKNGVLYLESICIERLAKIGKCNLKNVNNPKLPFVPKEDISGLETFYENIATIMPLLGYDIFIKTDNLKNKSSRHPDLFCSIGNDHKVRGELMEDGKIKILKGEMVRKDETDSFQTHPYKKLRAELIRKKRIVEDAAGNYIFSDDYVFNSPSAAAAVIKGRSVSGSIEWKTKEGKSLKDIVGLEIGN